MDARELAGWLPAIILPAATLLQVVKLARAPTAEGTSAAAWGLFAVANFGAYAFVGRPTAPQSLLAFLLTGILDVVIVVLCFMKRPPPSPSATDLP